MHTYSEDDVVVVVVPMKRGRSTTVRFRTSRYNKPVGGWTDADFQEMAAATVDKWLLVGPCSVTHVIPCR